MKTIVLFISSALLTGICANAQPVLTAKTTNPKAGDIYTYKNAKVKGVTAGNGGANMTWDYSTLKDSVALPDTLNIFKASGTPYAAAFPGANIAGTSSKSPGQYSYYTAKKTSLSVNGFASAADTGTYNPKYRLAQYPLTYGNMFTDTGSLVIADTGHTVFKEPYRDSVHVEGYGALKLPGRTFTNVLRVRTVTKVSFKIGGTTYTSRSSNIAYYVADYHDALLSISLNQGNNIFDVAYSVNAVPSAGNPEPEIENKFSATANTGFSIYPNPAVSRFTIQVTGTVEKSVTSIEINDVTGKNVFIKNANITLNESIDCSSFKAGVYFVKIKMTDGTEDVKKLMIAGK